jgi:hypothetical protein
LKYRLFLALALFILIVPGLLIVNGCSSPELPDESNKAAIIDQLSRSEPNQDFIAKATAALQNNGFEVDYYQGEEITVDLYRKLPALGYRLIVFRAHSGLMGNGRKADQKTCLFTNQLYNQTAEIRDQLSNRLVKAGTDENPPVFGINADFVGKSMKAEFSRTVVIMMGCSSLESSDMAQSFIQKGASVYTGWNESVGLAYVEDVTLTLLAKFFSPEVSIEAAVNATMREKGPDAESGAELKYYPETGGTTTLTGLLY